MKIYLLTTITLILFSCHDYRKEFTAIEFGKGGGFTGKYDAYKLDNTGNLYKIDHKVNSETFVKLLPAKQCKELFKTVSNAGISKLSINNPYNMSSYISLVTKTDTNRLVWGDPKKNPPQIVGEVFEKLMLLTK